MILVPPALACSFRRVHAAHSCTHFEGNWKQLAGKAKVQWGKLTDDDLDVIAGRRDQLSGKLQERYGIAKDDADKQIDTWSGTASDDGFDKPGKRI